MMYFTHHTHFGVFIMFIGIKHNALTSLTVNHAESYNSLNEGGGVTVLSTASNVIAPDAIQSYNVGLGVYNRITFLATTSLVGVALTVYARALVTDAWVEVKGISQAPDSNGTGIVVQISNDAVINALLIVSTYTDAQYNAIRDLTQEQQLVFATGSAAAKKTILNTLSIDVQALFTTTPVQFIQTVEQQAADKLRLDQIIFKLKSGQFVDDNDSVFYALNNSLMATAAMAIIDAGGGFDELRTAGLTQAQALSVLSIYNVNLDVNKYESEVALKIINDDPTKLSQLQAFLSGLTPPLTLPPLTPYLAQVRADHAVYTAIKNWSGS